MELNQTVPAYFDVLLKLEPFFFLASLAFLDFNLICVALYGAVRGVTPHR